MTTDPQDHAVGHALAKVATLDETQSINEKNEKGRTSPGDDFIVNSEGVTHEELRTLRNVADRLPLTAWLVIIVEFAERYVGVSKLNRMHTYVQVVPLTLFPASRWSYYGTTNVFNNYIRAPLPPGSTSGAVDAAHRSIGVAGALGRGQEISFAIRASAA
jgi:proton-dependent oligopeptide transporter, POT family